MDDLSRNLYFLILRVLRSNPAVFVISTFGYLIVLQKIFIAMITHSFSEPYLNLAVKYPIICIFAFVSGFGMGLLCIVKLCMRRYEYAVYTTFFTLLSTAIVLGSMVEFVTEDVAIVTASFALFMIVGIRSVWNLAYR